MKRGYRYKLLNRKHFAGEWAIGAERALQDARTRIDMAQSLRSAFRGMPRKIWQTLSSITTGVVLIILVVIFSAAGTVIVQRPMIEEEDIQRAYSPGMLCFLDATGLTDVFHTRWFV